MAQTIRMCSMCAGAFKYETDNHKTVPDTHAEVDEDCPTAYRE